MNNTSIGNNRTGLQGKTVVITGASSGIGRAAALAFAREKANVVLAARREQSLRDLAAECEKLGARTYVQPADVTDEHAVKAVAGKAVETFGRIDVWVNNAGVTLFGRIEETPPEVYRRVIDTNLFGYINGARAVIPRFREQGEGILINMSSITGRLAQPYTSAYNISKSAINVLSESLREELIDAPGIHVCTVLAPSVDTPLFQHAANYTGKALKPMQPVYKAEKVAGAIVQLAKHPEREVIVGGAGKQMAFMHAIAPGMAERMITRKVNRDHFQNRPAPSSEGNLFKPQYQWTGISGGWTNGAKMGMKTKLAMGLGMAGLSAAGVILARSRKHPKRRRLGILGV